MRVEQINRIVYRYFNIPKRIFYSKTRKREVALARQTSMYFSKILTNLKLWQIGKQTGRKDHTTVLNAIKQVNNLIDTNKQFKQHIDNIHILLGINFIPKKSVDKIRQSFCFIRKGEISNFFLYKSLINLFDIIDIKERDNYLICVYLKGEFNHTIKLSDKEKLINYENNGSLHQ